VGQRISGFKVNVRESRGGLLTLTRLDSLSIRDKLVSDHAAVVGIGHTSGGADFQQASCQTEVQFDFADLSARFTSCHDVRECLHLAEALSILPCNHEPLHREP
jgi:hypothetical protein